MVTLVEAVERHARAVVEGDAAAVAADFTPEGMMTVLEMDDERSYRPVSFTIEAVDGARAEITYVGEGKRTMSTTWRETRPGTWQITAIEERAN